MELRGAGKDCIITGRTPLTAMSNASIYLLLVMLKTLVLYIFSSDVVAPVFIFSNLVVYLTIFTLCGLLAQNPRKAYFIAHIAFSALIFIDINYYAYYGFLPSIRDVSLLSQVGAVRESFLGAFRPLSFLLLVDIPVMAIFYRKPHFRTAPKIRSTIVASGFKPVIAVFLIIVLFPLFAVNLNMDYVYTRFGAIAYHFSDLYDSLFNRPAVNPEQIGPGGYVNELAKEGRHFGIAQSRNVILVQLESFQAFLVGAEYAGVEITPNLNHLAKNDSIHFSRYYQQVGIGNTSDAEFIIHNSMHSMGRVSVYRQFSGGSYYTLPGLLKNHDYTTLVFHGNKGDFWNRKKMYESQGIDEFFSLERLEPDEMIAIGLSDGALFRQAAEILSNVRQPFYSLIITLTSHVPYTMPPEYEFLPIEEELQETQFGKYLQAVHYTDRALGEFIELLKSRDLYENSLIVLLGDHAGLYPHNEGNDKFVGEYLGRYYTIDEAMRIPLVFHVPGSGLNEEIEVASGQIDFFPTILNLLGIVEQSGLLFGSDMINEEQGFVPLQHVVPLGSFVDDEKFFLMSRDGVFKNSLAWKVDTLEPVCISECVDGYYKAIEQIRSSQLMISTDLLSELISGDILELLVSD